jgi:uncharacterized protein
MDLTLGLTHDCNLRCGYCYAGKKSHRSMSWRTAKAAIDFAIRETIDTPPWHSETREMQLGFFGGEPTIEWDLLTKAMEYTETSTTDAGITLKKTLTTNGTLLTDKRISWLKQHNVYIGLSMDGNREMHDSFRTFRNGKSCHARCTSVMHKLFSELESNVELIVVVDPRNVQYLPDSLRWLVGEGITNISLNPNFYIEWPDSAQTEWKRAYELAGELYLENYREGKHITINFIDGKIRTRIKDGYAACDRCSFAEIEIAVAPSGRMYPCERLISDDTDDDMCVGDVFSGFNGNKRSSLIVNKGNVDEDCAKCGFRARCMNWCGCINYATTGAINRVDGVVCFHEQMTIGIADKVAKALYAEANPYFLAKFYPEDNLNE